MPCAPINSNNWNRFACTGLGAGQNNVAAAAAAASPLSKQIGFKMFVYTFSSGGRGWLKQQACHLRRTQLKKYVTHATNDGWDGNREKRQNRAMEWRRDRERGRERGGERERGRVNTSVWSSHFRIYNVAKCRTTLQCETETERCQRPIGIGTTRSTIKSQYRLPFHFASNFLLSPRHGINV